MRNEEAIQGASVHHGPGCSESKGGRNGASSEKLAIPKPEGGETGGDALARSDVALLRRFFELLDRWDRESDGLDISEEAHPESPSPERTKIDQHDEA